MGRRFCFRTSFKISNDMDGNDPLDREGGDAPRAAHVGTDDAAEADRAAGEESFWAGAKYDFMHSGMSIRRIAEKHVVTEGTLRHRIKAWGWGSGSWPRCSLLDAKSVVVMHGC